MDKIIKLPQNLISKIAAGEVIERPASIIKELVENSIDANATSISIKVNDGGIKEITVSDNGEGMSHQDALRCFELHTTSKLKNLSDLDRIFSFGFRGEALASIAAISEVIIHTKSSKEEGIEVKIENGKLIDQKLKPRREGTTITVRDIFRHLPARKKFLRQPATEYRYILKEIYKIALAYPEIEIILEHNGAKKVHFKSDLGSEQRFTQIFKNINKESVIPLEHNSPDFKMKGFIIHPADLDKDRTRQYLFLNKRFIIEPSLVKAIKDGYSTSIPKEKNPAFVLNLELDPSRVDINIHPKKLEAKIENIRGIFSGLRATVDSTLNLEHKAQLENKLNQFRSATKAYTFEKKDVGSVSEKSSSPYYRPKFDYPSAQPSLAFTQNLFEESHTLNPFFQVFDTYIVIEKEDSLEFIDQHAADERINYERIFKKLNDEKTVESQDLMIPIIIELQEDQVSLINKNAKLFLKMGIDVDPFGESTIKINSQPVFSRSINFKELFAEILSALNNEDGNLSDLNHRLAASLACHGSIRAGQRLNDAEMKKIIQDLFNCEKPYSCPHGRPISWTIERCDIERKFERIK